MTAQIFPFGTEYKDRQNMPNGTHWAGVRAFSLTCCVTQRAAEMVAWTF
jgi:hypothetical protein